MTRDLFQEAFGAMRHDLRKTVLTMQAAMPVLKATTECWRQVNHSGLARQVLKLQGPGFVFQRSKMADQAKEDCAD